jgi:hypothetical protein
MRIRFSLRTMLLAIFAIAAFLAFCRPVARINPAACTRILPGMTAEQAINVVGAPPGWYDGVGGVSSDVPYDADSPYDKRFEGLSWVGMRGEIVVQLKLGRVSKATFYPVRIIGWWPPDCFWERFTRIQYLGLSVAARVFLFVALTVLATFVLSLTLIDSRAKNGAASHGLIGLILGVTLTLAIFSNDFNSDDFTFTWDPVVTLLALSSALVFGAFVGIFVGFVRGWLPRWQSRNTQDNVIANPTAVA